ncbi:proton-conducting transporter membrane subunit [Oceanicella actignis]|uniref:proton-conducting transporter transmembrane domain-containing protein n=1 Tax=Oceanicella actignis TaxID=1189325 RepID=UPI0011E88068|nr:proton-conducting transporter membrane subunit [Oceanicella actignis]TYO89234.1 NAD(P)H-quinone oxidoreductase subunit 5 [Oceanicella actignis]
MTAFPLAPAQLAPLVLAIAAAAMMMRPGRRPPAARLLPQAASLAALALALGGAALAGADEGGGPMRADAIGATMATLVAFIGWIVTRYAARYMDGEPREGRFHALMLATLAAVLVLAQAAHLALLAAAFAATGLLLRQLLLFYPERPAARRAAAKFALVWHAGDAALILAAAILWAAHGLGDMAALRALIGEAGPGAADHVAAALVVLAALLKTAAFPAHGWLTEVMEAPTPVSALLHAGVVNAGGVLLIRLADLVQASPAAMAALAFMGGLTALFGAVVMLAQSAVKTALAWSTVGQMGFMLLQCGLGLWPLALLHIIAHGLYKSHAFLTAGMAVAEVRAARKPGPVAAPGWGAVARAFALSLALYAAMAGLFMAIAGPKSPQALALGAMLVFGVAYLVAQGLADAAPRALTWRTALASAGAAAAYFGFQLGAQALWGAHLPAPPDPGPLEWALIVLAVGSFGLVALAQALFPLWAHHPAAAGLRVHVANGFYLNALLDKAIGGFRTVKAK